MSKRTKTRRPRHATGKGRPKIARSARVRGPVTEGRLLPFRFTQVIGDWPHARLGKDAGLFLLLTGAVFMFIWWPVIFGRQDLVGGDVLYDVLPWSANGIGRIAANGLVGDTVLQMLPWQELVRQAFLHGQLPTWDAYSYSGTPLLANYQSAPFSLFNWIALPLAAAHGTSIAMLAKLWIAGIGMALFVRSMGTRMLSAGVAGVAYACCSYMTVWLGWPNSSVAAIAPWTFALSERYVVSGQIRSLVCFALAITVELLAGHPETCAHMSLALSIYLVIRCAAQGRNGIQRFLPLAASACIGVLGAAIQVVPFLMWLKHIHGVNTRAGIGTEHLSLQTLTSWLVPNGRGNPGIDHNTLAGLPPDYNESTGFVGVGALILALIGVREYRHAGWSRVLALTAIVILGAGTVYGPLTAFLGRLPVLDASANWRMTSIMCLALSALAGLGLDALWGRPAGLARRRTTIALVIGAVALASLGLAEIALLSSGARVESLLPSGPDHYFGFWLAVSAGSFVAGVAFTLVGLWGGRSRDVLTGFAALVVLEALLFAVPYNPRETPDNVPPPSGALTWLQHHAGMQAVTATGSVMPAESATLYGLHDVRGYEAGLVDARQIMYWHGADPGFNPTLNRDVSLVRPRASWLAAAGVAYVVTPESQSVPGTRPEYTGEGVTISAVPRARPFAFAGIRTVPVRDSTQVLRLMHHSPLSPIPVERACCLTGTDASARTVVLERQATRVTIAESSRHATTLVVLQSVSPGWTARVDGNPAPIRPADIIFQSIRVPGGRHTIVIQYEAPGLGLGALLTALSVLVMILMSLAPRTHRWWATRESGIFSGTDAGH